MTDPRPTSRPGTGEERYRALVSHLADAVFLLDEAGLVVEANPAGTVLLGRRGLDAPGTELGAFLAPAHRTRAAEALSHAATHGVADVDLTMTRPGEDAAVELHVTVVLVTLDGGEPGFWVLVEDVSAARALAREVELARALAVAAARTRSDFVARTSHEIRTPLTSIIAVTDLLAETSDEEERRLLCETMERSSRRLLRLVDNVLTFAAGDAAADPHADEAFDLRSVVRDAVDLARAGARRKGLTMDLDLDSDVPQHVRDHPTWTSQILDNLLSNAVAFTEHGGIRLSVSFSQSTTAGPHVIYRVADTGVGIPPEHTRLIFEPFERPPPEGEASRSGIGLGLNMVHQLVSLSGGTIVFTSTPGTGTTFTVSMPVRAVATDLPPQQEA